MKIFFTYIALFAIFMMHSQNANSDYLIISSDIRLPKDSIENKRLVSNLNDFLLAVQQPNENNPWILVSEKPETYILLDEFKNISRTKNDNYFFKPYLTNIIEINDQQYLIQISYIGIKENISSLRASFELIAHKNNDNFLFSSPLLRNTKNWKIAKINNCIFHYQNYLNRQQAELYAKDMDFFDKLLQTSTITQTELYICENFIDAQKLIGMNYKLDYNGYNKNSMLIMSENKIITIHGINNFEEYDPHDLFHERTSIAIPNERNHYMVCGCAYIYGGSWGISWNDIKKMFKNKMHYDKNTDWLQLYFKKYNFSENNKQPLYINQYINALIIQKVEKEQGFSKVIKLLSSGDMYNNKEKFFEILEEVTGINEKNFNEKITKIISNAMD
jgi:hypothetical protein